MKNPLRTRRERKELERQKDRESWKKIHKLDQDHAKSMGKAKAMLKEIDRDWKQTPIIERLDKIISLLKEKSE